MYGLLWIVLATDVIQILVSIVVSIPACHAGDPGSIPGRGVHFFVAVRDVVQGIKMVVLGLESTAFGFLAQW